MGRAAQGVHVGGDAHAARIVGLLGRQEAGRAQQRAVARDAIGGAVQLGDQCQAVVEDLGRAVGGRSGCCPA